MNTTYIVEKTLLIFVQPNEIFDVMTHFERWNQWTTSITEISVLNNDDLKPGSKIKVLQPKLPPAIWTITEVTPYKSLTWEKKSLGLNMRSEHLITGEPDKTTVTLRITYEGLFACIFYYLTHSLTDRYMTMEINGLKKECEKV